MSTSGPPEAGKTTEVIIDGMDYVPFKAADVTINGVRYVPQAVPADVVINGVEYVPDEYGEPDVIINAARYVPWARWRPIETAPQGGHWVLLWWAAANPFGPTPGYWGLSGWRGVNGQWWAPGPTHWMPLPPHP